jgi:hypothetical protein
MDEAVTPLKTATATERLLDIQRLFDFMLDRVKGRDDISAFYEMFGSIAVKYLEVSQAANLTQILKDIRNDY